MKKGIWWIVGIVVVIVIVIVASGRSKSAEAGPIKIGFIGPLTGDAASYGQPTQKAAMMAVDEINSSGGIGGRSLEVVYEDGKCGTQAATAAQKLINVDNIKLIIGGGCSGESLAALPVASAAKAVLLSPMSSSPALTGASKYFARNYPSDALPGARIAEYMISKGMKNAAVVTETSDTAVGLHKVFVDRFTQLGGKVVADETFTTGSRDFRSSLSKIKNAQPQAVYILGQTPVSDEVILKQAAAVGLKAQLFGGFEIFGGDTLLASAAKELEGAIYMEPSLDETATTTADFVSKYKRLYGSFGGLPAIYAATTYDAVYLMKDMIQKYGTDADKIAEGLRQIKDWKGAAGSLTINQDGDAEFQYTMRIIHNGKVETLANK